MQFKRPYIYYLLSSDLKQIIKQNKVSDKTLKLCTTEFSLYTERQTFDLIFYAMESRIKNLKGVDRVIPLFSFL